jgi:hypothetical protein
MGRKYRRNSIGGQFTSHRVDMVASPAWRALSLSARKCLERIELELAKHGGNNGDLPVTQRDFIAHGVSGARVKAALAELIAFGFIEMTPGYGCQSPLYGRSARFRALSCASRDGPPPENWKRFKTDAEAKAMSKAVLAEARRARTAHGEAMRKRRAKKSSHASPDDSQGESLASGSLGESLSGRSKVNHCPPSQSESLSTISGEGRSQAPPAVASAAPPAAQASRRARPERSGTPAAAVQPDADEAEPSPWSDQPPEPAP